MTVSGVGHANIALAIATTLALIGCSETTPPSNRASATLGGAVTPLNTPAMSAEPAAMAGGTAQLALIYPNVAALAQDASTIVSARVEATEERPYGNLPFTLATLRIEESVRGGHAGQMIAVLETGGTLPGSPKHPASTTSPALGYGGVPPHEAG